MKKIQDLMTFKSTSSDRIPTIPLYMDQVLSYLDQVLSPLKRKNDETTLTKTMINNYVKSNVIPAPKKKKYDHNHLMGLTMIYRLKATMSMKDIETLYQSQGSEPLSNYYQDFLEIEANVNADLQARIGDFDLNQKEDIKKAILMLAIHADTEKRLIEHLIDQLAGASDAK